MTEENKLDWNKAKKHFDYIRQQYLDLEGVAMVNTTMALRIGFDPLAKRYNSGERTEELYEKMLAVE